MRYAVLVVTALTALPVSGQEPVDDKKANQTLNEFNQRVGNGKDERTLMPGLVMLGQFKNPLLVKRLTDFLNHPSSRVRTQAIQAVVTYTGEKAAHAALLTALKSEFKNIKIDDQANDRGFEPAVEILRGLGKFPSDKATTDALIGALKHKSVFVPAMAAEACGELKDAGTVEELLKLFREAELSKATRIETIVVDPNGGGTTDRLLSASEVAQMVEYRRKTEIGKAARQALVRILGEEKKTHAEFTELWNLKKRELTGKKP